MSESGGIVVCPHDIQRTPVMTTQSMFDLGSAESVSTPKAPRIGESRMLKPNRGQVEWRMIAPDGLLSPDHAARRVVAFVEKLDLSVLRDPIQSKEAQPGRPAIDPSLLFALWVYATTRGVASARELERLCRQHVAYQWICGGVEVGAHTLSDFRAERREQFDVLLTNSVAVMMKHGLVKVKRVAQDGMRVRASAGAASFRRKKTLEECLVEVEKHLAALRAIESDDAATARSRAAKILGAEGRRDRLAQALQQMPAVEVLKARNRKKGEDPDKNPARVSTTDPDARVMKMPDGGFRPAFNVQMATDTESQVVLGVSITNEGSDRSQMLPMIEQIEQRHGAVPEQYLVDGGFVNLEQIDAVAEKHVEVLAPVPKPRNSTRDPHEPLESDSKAVAEWRKRMKTDKAKETYKQRASTAECVNANARKNGLTQFPSRGLVKALGCALLVALAHNCTRAVALGFV